MHRGQPAAPTDSRPLRVGIVGTGFGSRVVAEAFRTSGWQVADVVTARDPEGVRALCHSTVDLISIQSPPFLHAEHVTWAVDAGRAVLCDKPFGTSVEEAAGMVEAAEAAGVSNFLNFEFRHQPARMAMSEVLESGTIGSPEHLVYTAFTSGSRPSRPWGWLFDRSLGGGWIGAFGSHAIDLVRWLLGEVADAGAESWITVPERVDVEGGLHRCDAEDAFAGWMAFRSGATAVVDSSSTAGLPMTPRIVVTGSEGAVEDIGDARVVVHRKDGSKEQLTFDRRGGGGGDPHDDAMVAWTGAIRDSLSSGEPTGPSFADGLACMRVMERWRRVPPTGPGGPESAT